MRFTPMSEEDAQGCFPKGEYDALVTKALDKVSKSSGNEMIELELTVYGPGGKERLVRDWLVNTDGGQAKIQRFCRAVDKWETYLAGELTSATCLDANVCVKLAVEEGDGQYPPKNTVRDYLPSKTVAIPEPPGKSNGGMHGVSPQQRTAAGVGRADPAKPPTEDEIPF